MYTYFVILEQQFLVCNLKQVIVHSRYMRTECLNYKYAHDDTLPVSRLISSLGNKMQTCTQRYDRRPYGVGLLVAGYDVRIYCINNRTMFIICQDYRFL